MMDATSRKEFLLQAFSDYRASSNGNFFENSWRKAKSQPAVKTPDRFTDRWTRERRMSRFIDSIALQQGLT